MQFADILTLRNNEKYIVADGYIYGEDDDYDCDSCELKEYWDHDLSYTRKSWTSSGKNKTKDIVKVERNGKVIWERQENQSPKEMTLSEICKALGYEVKVIKED